MSRVSRICSTCDRWLSPGETRCLKHRALVPTWGVVVEAPKLNGKRRRKVRKGFATRKEAEVRLAALVTELDDGSYIERNELNVETWMRRWLELSAQRVKPSTLSSYEVSARLHINPAIGSVKLQRLDLSTIELFYADLAGRVSNKTVRNTHAILRRSLADAQKRGLIRTNPAEGAFTLRLEKHELEIWDAAQLSNFLDFVEGDRFGRLFYVAASTGMRRGELIALKWADVTEESILVRRSVTRAGSDWVETEPKSGKPRRIDLDERTTSSLREQKQAGVASRLRSVEWHDLDLVFPHETTGRHLDGDVISQSFKKAVAKAGLPDQRLHDLRHIHATVMLAAGVPAHVVSQRLGHHSVGFTLDTYAWVLDGQQREAAQMFAAALDGRV